MPNEITGINFAYVLDLYERYKQNPESVDARTRAFFAHWSPPPIGETPSLPEQPMAKVAAAVQLGHAIRAFGHLAAHLDPLGAPPHGDPAVDPSTYNLTEEDLRRLPASLISGAASARASNTLDAINWLRDIYSSSIGFDYHQVHIPV